MGRRRKRLNQTLFNIIGLMVVVSMVIGGLSLSVISTSKPTSTPTVLFLTTPPPSATVTPTAAPSATATRPTATATPAATATPVADTISTPIPLGSRDEESFIFAVCGDSRGGDEVYREILRHVEEDGAAFLVNAGDLVQSGTERQFQDFEGLMSGFTLPFFPVPGNHDARDGKLNEYLEYSGAPAAQYSFDYGLGHFVVADSHSGVIFPKELGWLDADLAASGQPLKVVFLHHPPFDPDGTDHTMRLSNDEFMVLMEKHGVSYVFAGHIHAYAEETRNGVRYLITGGAGAPLYAKDHPQAFYHYVRVTVNGTDVSTEVIKIRP